MAVVSRIARVRITTATGGFREYTATAAVQDTPAGASVVVTVALTAGGTLQPGPPTNPIELNFYIDNGATLIKTVTFAVGSLPQNETFFFTTNGLTGGAARFGTVRMRVRVERATGAPTDQYHVDSDGTNNTPPTGGSTQLDQGWIRATQTATVTASNISAGGAKTEPAQRNEVVHHRAVMQAVGYSSYATVHTFTGTSKSITVTSTSATRDATFTGTGLANGRVNYGFPAADATYTATVSLTTNSALTGLPIGVFSSVTTDTLQVDPRFTSVHLFQVGDNSIGTPPLSKNNTDKERGNSAIGYLGTGVHHARGGVSGDVMSGGLGSIELMITLTAPNGTVISRTVTTGTEGGELGWTPGFMEWTNTLPGGDWTKQVVITAPSDAGSADYLLNSTDTLFLIGSRDPNVALVVDAGHSGSDANDRHMVNGDDFEVSAFFEFTKLGEEKLLPADTAEPLRVACKRVRGKQVYSWDGTSFVLANPNINFLPMTRQSTYVWEYTTPTDDDWSDVIVQCSGKYQQVVYAGQANREFVGSLNQHDALTLQLAVFTGDFASSTGARWTPGDVFTVTTLALSNSDGSVSSPSLATDVRTYAITGVDQGAKKFIVGNESPSDVLAELRVGRVLTIEGSTGNDGSYRVADFATVGADTEITVQEAIPSATADGIISNDILQPSVIIITGYGPSLQLDGTFAVGANVAHGLPGGTYTWVDTEVWPTTTLFLFVAANTLDAAGNPIPLKGDDVFKILGSSNPSHLNEFDALHYVTTGHLSLK